jgi:hypothetical protein
MSAYHNSRYKNDPEYRARALARSKSWQAAHKDDPDCKMRSQQRSRAYYALVKDKPEHKARVKILNAKHNAIAKARRSKTPLESKIEAALCDAVRMRGGMALKFMDPSRRGAPDRLVLLPGHPTHFVELKRPNGEGKLEPWQERYHADIRRSGQRVWVLYSFDDVDAFMAEMDMT